MSAWENSLSWMFTTCALLGVMLSLTKNWLKIMKRLSLLQNLSHWSLQSLLMVSLLPFPSSYNQLATHLTPVWSQSIPYENVNYLIPLTGSKPSNAPHCAEGKIWGLHHDPHRPTWGDYVTPLLVLPLAPSLLQIQPPCFPPNMPSLLSLQCSCTDTCLSTVLCSCILQGVCSQTQRDWASPPLFNLK